MKAMERLVSEMAALGTMYPDDIGVKVKSKKQKDDTGKFIIRTKDGYKTQDGFTKVRSEALVYYSYKETKTAAENLGGGQVIKIA